MPSRNSPHTRGRKAQGKLRSLRRVLILCEDEKSSVLYLKKFPIDRSMVEIKCEGTGYNTDSLMEVAIERKRDAIKRGNPYQEIWVVFDRDSFLLNNFNRAFDLAANHTDIHACWSNECFELWYLFHFGFRQTGIDRNAIFKELSRLLNREYDKADAEIYDLLKDKTNLAIQHALKLQLMNAPEYSLHANPSTMVHRLILRLMEFAPISAI